MENYLSGALHPDLRLYVWYQLSTAVNKPFPYLVAKVTMALFSYDSVG